MPINVEIVNLGEYPHTKVSGELFKMHQTCHSNQSCPLGVWSKSWSWLHNQCKVVQIGHWMGLFGYAPFLFIVRFCCRSGSNMATWFRTYPTFCGTQTDPYWLSFQIGPSPLNLLINQFLRNQFAFEACSQLVKVVHNVHIHLPHIIFMFFTLLTWTCIG